MKSIGKLLLVIFVIIIFGFGQSYPANFIVPATILTLLYIIDTLSKSIDDKEDKIKTINELLSYIDTNSIIDAERRIKNDKNKHND